MGLFDGWGDAWADAKALHGLSPNTPRAQGVLTGGEVQSFMDAAEERPTLPPRSIENVRAELARKNPVRMARLAGDMRWMRRQMVKMGLNPEDAKYVL